MIASRIKLQCDGAKCNKNWALRRILCNGLGLLLLAALSHVSAFQAPFSAVLRSSRDHSLPITCLQSTASDVAFDVDKALFCAGLAFDAYVEPNPDSSRWERGVSDAIFHSNESETMGPRFRIRETIPCRLHIVLSFFPLRFPLFIFAFFSRSYSPKE